MSSGYVKGLAGAWSAVVVAGFVGAEFQSITGGMPIWPATGIAAGIALSRPRTTPAIAVALLSAHFGNGTPWGVAMAWGVLTAIAVVLFASASRYLDRERKGNRGLWFTGLALVTAATTATLASSVGSAVQFVAESQSTTFALHWMTGDLMSLLILAPAVRALLVRRRLTEAWTGPESRRSADLGATLPPIARVHPARDAAVDDRARGIPRSLAPAGSGATEHPVLAEAAYFVWDRSSGQVSAQGDTLRHALDESPRASQGSAGEGWPEDAGQLDPVTDLCADWLRAAGPETRRAVRRALVGLRRNRAPIDLRLPLTAPGSAETGAAPHEPTLRVRAWASYRPNGRLARVHGVVEDLRPGLQAELRAELERRERILTLERELDQLRGAVAAQTSQDLQIEELLLLMQKSLADADSLLGEFDLVADSSLTEDLADRTFDVAASIRKALRVTRKLAARDDRRPRRPSGPTAGREGGPASLPRPVGFKAAPRWSRRAISVAALLKEDDA